MKIKSSFNSLFGKEDIKSQLPFNIEELGNVIDKNRKALSLVDNWIDEKAFKQSYYSYGVPRDIYSLLNLPIGNDPTYSDYLVYYSNCLKKTISYLELGVSVGKNFFQIVNGLENAIITGFDIEDINPILEGFLEFNQSSNFSLSANSIRTSQAQYSKYHFKSNYVNYLAGDIWDENCWSHLEGNKFNLIFSDALHDPKALLHEFDMIRKFNLLDENFIILWDDLGKDLFSSFKIIGSKLRDIYGSKAITVYKTEMNGWLGQNYALKHNVGLITNIRLK